MKLSEKETKKGPPKWPQWESNMEPILVSRRHFASSLWLKTEEEMPLLQWPPSWPDPTAPAAPTPVLLHPSTHTDPFSLLLTSSAAHCLAGSVNLSCLLLLLRCCVGFRGGSADCSHCRQPLGPRPVSGLVCGLWPSSVCTCHTLPRPPVVPLHHSVRFIHLPGWWAP